MSGVLGRTAAAGDTDLILVAACDLLHGSLTTTFGGANLALTVSRRCLPVLQKAAGGLLQLAAAFDPTLCCSIVRRSRTLWGVKVT
jgi:hypothetical protein